MIYKLAVFEKGFGQDIKGEIKLPEREVQKAEIDLKPLAKVLFIGIVVYVIINILKSR